MIYQQFKHFHEIPYSLRVFKDIEKDETKMLNRPAFVNLAVVNGAHPKQMNRTE